MSRKDSTDRPYWFAFQDNRLLIRTGAEGPAVPLAREAAELGLAPMSTQYVGLLSGRACWSAELAPDTSPPAGMSLEPLRSLWGALEEDLFWMGGLAFQVVDFERSHRFCGRCGAPTREGEGERSRVCPGCGYTAYPRIAPAIITAVTRGGRILLARASRFPTALYSVIAGFVDPGESLEQCLHREVAEEVGITVKNLRYFGSQSWPFPHSLMVAFTAEYAGGEVRIDGREIVDAGWYGPGDLPRIPEPLSISRRLIDWFLERQGAAGDQRP